MSAAGSCPWRWTRPAPGRGNDGDSLGAIWASRGWRYFNVKCVTLKPSPL